MDSRECVIVAGEFKGYQKHHYRYVYLPPVFDKYPQVEELYKYFPSF